MAQRDVVKVAGGLVAGVAVTTIVLAASGISINLFGDTETDINLFVIGTSSACTLGKETVVRVKRGKKLTWKIRNYCTTAKTVTVGNFRIDEASETQNCDQATAGNAEFPFTEEARTATVQAAETRNDGSIKPAKAEIKMKARDMGDQEFPYYYDICQDGQKGDPRLIIER